MSNFKIIKESKISSARVSEFKTSHGTIQGPFFMPIATRGVLKNLTPDELKDLGAQIILGNTYHLMLRPGIDIIKKAGGLHKFMDWDGPILTDSGGYQVFSLKSKVKKEGSVKRSETEFYKMQSAKNKKPVLNEAKNQKIKVSNFDVKITDKGIAFQSEIDGQKIFLSPEKAIEIQLALGSDIIMALDECAPYPCDYEYAKKAMERTTEWAKIGIMNHESRIMESRLFGIIQGSIYKDLRIRSAKEITALNFDGYAIGGVAVGEPREKMWDVLDWIMPYLPEDKPRYLMGLGRPEEIVEAIRRGIDMFDCVIPTRNARHGTLWCYPDESRFRSGRRGIPYQKFKARESNFYEILHITNEKFKKDFLPVDKNCSCYTCQHYSRAYLRHLFMLDEPLGLRLATIHNLAFYLGLMKEIREVIRDERL
jgi:queuine tRNA-ribosyltransferase